MQDREEKIFKPFKLNQSESICGDHCFTEVAQFCEINLGEGLCTERLQADRSALLCEAQQCGHVRDIQFVQLCFIFENEGDKRVSSSTREGKRWEGRRRSNGRDSPGTWGEIRKQRWEACFDERSGNWNGFASDLQICIWFELLSHIGISNRRIKIYVSIKRIEHRERESEER